MPLEQAQERLLGAIEAISHTQTLAIEQALDRTLAETVSSPIDVPGFDNSAMDGYALCFAGASAAADSQFTQVGKSFAGDPYDGPLVPGQCVRIMTGAALPTGAQAVIMQENTEFNEDSEQLTLGQACKQGDNIRRRANDIARGTEVLAQGRRLNPADLGLLASLGLAQVEVYRPIKVGLFSSGDELCMPGQPLEPGCIYESNRFVVKAILARLGAEILDLGIIPDRTDALEAAFLQAASECDAVISSGGVSVGEADYTKTVLDKIGQIDFWKLAIKPGKPFAFGSINGTPFFGLPGNPSSAAVTFHQLALPCLQKLAGERAHTSPSFVMPAPVN
ncbi:MAG: molybdopterin molybdotransferase MoeA, partial [Cellvibrionaceae bacterium]|nr:molybdopterin molybdotransferase MoeA [Cellvibrionaceae bacterium]